MLLPAAAADDDGVVSGAGAHASGGVRRGVHVGGLDDIGGGLHLAVLVVVLGALQ